MRGDLVFSITKDDFEIQTFRSGGKGGQNQNKVESGVRIIHKASGCVSEAREQRDQIQNKRIAFKRLIEQPKFKAWFNYTCCAVVRKTISNRDCASCTRVKVVKVCTF